jgi:hypothetical protein
MTDSFILVSLNLALTGNLQAHREIFSLVLYMIDPLSILTKPKSDLSLRTFDYVPVDRSGAPLESKATDAWKPQLRQNDLAAVRWSSATSIHTLA